MDGADAEGVDHANRHRQRYEAPGTGEVNVLLAATHGNRTMLARVAYFYWINELVWRWRCWHYCLLTSESAGSLDAP